MPFPFHIIDVGMSCHVHVSAHVSNRYYLYYAGHRAIQQQTNYIDPKKGIYDGSFHKNNTLISQSSQLRKETISNFLLQH